MKNIIILIFLTLGIWWSSCSDLHGTDTPEIMPSSFIDSMPGTAPHLTKNADGQVVLSWVRETNDSTFSFCYATSNDGGQTFNNPIVIPQSSNIKPHSENLPKVIFKPSGEALAIWGAASSNKKNKYSGSIYYAQSFDDGVTWSAARPLVTDTAGYDQRYFDVSLLPNGEVGIIWLDNRKDTGTEGSALYYAVTDGHKGFNHEKRIMQGCCQCCRTDLFVDSKSGIHVLYRGIVQDSIRDMVHIVSTNGGKTFSAPQRISNDNWVLNACPHTGPAMTENKDGLHFTWYTGGKKKGTFYTQSADNGQHFIQQDSVSGAGKHPQLTADAADGLAIVWDEFVKKDNEIYSRIGFQKRTPDGKNIRKWFLTQPTINATYPVITIAQNNQPVVAYCQKKGEKAYIAYQVIKQ